MAFPRRMNKSRLTRDILAAASALLLLLVLACAPTSEPQEMEAPLESAGSAAPVVEQPLVEIGNDIGNRIPDFTLELAEGATVTSASLVEQGQPAFLFFFSTT